MRDRVNIRRAHDGDCQFVADLADALLEFGSPIWEPSASRASRFRRVLADAVRNQDGRSAVLIAEAQDGTPLGFISLNGRQKPAAGRRAHVADLAVRENARHMGVGTALLRAGETWAREQGLDVLSLDVWSTNGPAMQFYSRLGFQPESVHLIRSLT